MIAVLLLNNDCSISALVEVEQYLAFQYQEQGLVKLRVEIEEKLFDMVKDTMWVKRQNCYVLTKQHGTVATPVGALVLVCDLDHDVPSLCLK